MQGIHAQEFTGKNKTTFGIKGGFINSYISSVDKNTQHGVGIYGGLFSNYRFHKKWSFQNEVNFTITNGSVFVEIPFLLEYHINKKWSVFIGPKMDFLINNDSRYPYDTQYKTLGLSAEIGIQYNISKKLFIEARYGYSFTNQLEIGRFHSRNRQTFRIGMGFRF